MKKPTKNAIKKELKALVAEIAEVDQDKVTDDARFVEDLGMDSMMALEILAAIEERYRIHIPEDILPKLTSLEEAVRLTGRIIRNSIS
jgi:acyl carrier protein